MEKLDLTTTENAIKFAKNHRAYIPHTSLPKEVLEKINELDNDYTIGMITGMELYNQVLDEIMRFGKTLK